jgi:hypothetical protein
MLAMSAFLLGPMPLGLAQTAVTHGELDRLEAEIRRAEDVSAVKRLQRVYGYYLDKGMWADLAELFADDAVANYPAGVFVGKESIRKHLFLNVGGGEIGATGLGDGRLYDHMNTQPVVHLDPGGETAEGRWRAFATFGRIGGEGVWAEGVYEIGYVKDGSTWKIQRLDYHAGFAAPFSSGWVDPGPEGRRTRQGELAHPPDRERDRSCEGFPDACLAPFHYGNPGTTEGGRVWTDTGTGDVAGSGDIGARAQELLLRAHRLSDEQAIENLQRVYGYYLDQGLWDEAAALFAEDGTIELGLQGVYRGPEKIGRFLNLMGPAGGEDGWLNDHLQLQIVVSVDADSITAKSRSRELAMTGVYGDHGEWSAGIYENTYVRQGDVWRIRSLHFYPTFIAGFEGGWTQDFRSPPGVSEELPPDAPPSERYAIYPAAHIPPYHYRNPVTGAAPVYPDGDGRPTAAAIRAATAPVNRANSDRASTSIEQEDIESAVREAFRLVARVKDYDELENLQSAYGYYLDKNLWNDLADLFAEDSSMELAQRGVYAGPGRVRGFLLNVFGRGGEGPVAGTLGNHIQWQPVISIAPDGRTGQIRSRMLQQMSRGGRASMGAAIYENEVVKEDGRWRFASVHAYNTWGGGYGDGWVKNASTYVPGPSADYPPDAPPSLEFAMFPNVYRIPFHYANPGR